MLSALGTLKKKLVGFGLATKISDHSRSKSISTCLCVCAMCICAFVMYNVYCVCMYVFLWACVCVCDCKIKESTYCQTRRVNPDILGAVYQPKVVEVLQSLKKITKCYKVSLQFQNRAHLDFTWVVGVKVWRHIQLLVLHYNFYTMLPNLQTNRVEDVY